MGSNNTSVKVVAFSTGLVALILWIVGYFIPDLVNQLPPGGEATISTMIAVVVSWITPNPND